MLVVHLLSEYSTVEPHRHEKQMAFQFIVIVQKATRWNIEFYLQMKSEKYISSEAFKTLNVFFF